MLPAPDSAVPSTARLTSPPEPFAALIFDCDGTLADTAPLHYRAWAAALADVGADLPEPWYYARVGLSRDDLLGAARAAFGVAFDVEAVSAAHARRYGAALPTVRAVAHVAAVARAAHGRVPLAVASGGQRAIVLATLDALGLTALFDAVVTIEDVTGDGVARGKPAPDLFLAAARRLGVAPAACVVYEDSDEGLEAARRAGMRAVDVRTDVRVDLREDQDGGARAIGERRP
jgi:beta-phosphoglucomutase-like phosphatase (HAD superfamily)